MKPKTEQQRLVLAAVCRIVSHTGRGALLREVADEMGSGVSTIYHQIDALIKQGLIVRGHGRGIFPVTGDEQYRQGWNDATNYLRAEITTLLVQHHASGPLIAAVDQTIADTASATPKEGTCTAEESAPGSRSEAN
jgi:predicted transcriptional regulator